MVSECTVTFIAFFISAAGLMFALFVDSANLLNSLAVTVVTGFIHTWSEIEYHAEKK